MLYMEKQPDRQFFFQPRQQEDLKGKDSVKTHYDLTGLQPLGKGVV